MELKSLMSGIAVVIDDKIEDRRDEAEDRIVKIVEQVEREWNLPFYKAKNVPAPETWPNLLRAASFILLDWKLWPSDASQLKQASIETNIQFLKQARDYLVPVFIFTNEGIEDVTNELPEEIYHEESPEKSFVFIQRKTDLLPDDGSLNFSAIENWVRKNASVYALKAWEQSFYAAKKELFSSMYKKNSDWPKVFWKAYEEDSVDPNLSLMDLINDNLRGRMRANAFEEGILDSAYENIPREDLQALIGEVSFQGIPSENEIRCGDLFKLPGGKFLLNLRPDCDCIPRDDQEIDRVQLYCVEGKKMTDRELRKQYEERVGHFEEKVWETVVFAAGEGKSVRFNFKKLCIEEFSELKDKRIGRLLHPFLTRIQQRFGLYLQRQALPRIPEAAIPPKAAVPQIRSYLINA